MVIGMQAFHVTHRVNRPTRAAPVALQWQRFDALISKGFDSKLTHPQPMLKRRERFSKRMLIAGEQPDLIRLRGGEQILNDEQMAQMRGIETPPYDSDIHITRDVLGRCVGLFGIDKSEEFIKCAAIFVKIWRVDIF